MPVSACFSKSANQTKSNQIKPNQTSQGGLTPEYRDTLQTGALLASGI
jgi:hypothetical protein